MDAMEPHGGRVAQVRDLARPEATPNRPEALKPVRCDRIDLVWSIFTTFFGIGSATLVLGALAVFVFMPELATRLVPVLLVAGALFAAFGYVERLQDELADTRAEVKDLNGRVATAEAKAAANATAATEPAGQLRRQAESYRADAAAARFDADRFAVARQAAEAAERACGERQVGAVPGAVHRAIAGEPVTSEDAPASASMKGALEALRKVRR